MKSSYFGNRYIKKSLGPLF